jgi:hypothetical protein
MRALSIAVLFLLTFSTFAEPAKKSSAQAESDQKRAKIMKDQQDKSMLQNNPQKFFDAYVKEKVILVKGKPFILNRAMQGRVVQNIDAKLLLMREEFDSPLDHSTHYGDMYVLELESTKGIADGDMITKMVEQIGMYEYVAVIGSKKTVRKYAPVKFITFDEFKELVKKGTDVINIPEYTDVPEANK